MSDTATGQSVMSRALECSICLEIYNLPDKLPKTLVCGHTFCSPCLRNTQETVKVKCSKCRQDTVLTTGNVDQLPTNFTVIEILESTCQLCREQQWIHKCEHCNKNLCEACTKSHLDDEQKDMKEELIYAKKSVENMSIFCLSDTLLNDVRSQEKSTEKAVRSFWASIRQKVDEREEADIEKTILYFGDIHTQIESWQSNLNLSVTHASATIDKYLSKLDAAKSSQFTESEQSRMRQDYHMSLEDININLAKNPNIKFFQLNTNIPDIISTGIINICDITDFQKITEKPYKITLSSCKPRTTRSKPDYKLATFSQSYGQHGSGPGEFSCPWDIATSPVTGNVVVSDYLNHRVHYLTSSLQPLSVYGSKGSGDQQLHHPWGVAVSNKGKVYIADRDNHRIHVTDENGKCLSVIKSDRFRSPRGIAVDNNGLLYVCDSDNYQIQVIQEDGSFVREFGSQGTNPGQFEYKPSFIAVSSDGKLVVSDYSKNIYILTTQGKHIRTITANPSTSFTDPNGVAIDPDGNIIVADGAGQLVVMTEEGEVICQIGTKGTGPGQLGSPRGVILTLQGDILVCDKNNHRIQMFIVPKFTA